MLAGLNSMLDARARGEEPDFDGFMQEFGDFFPGEPQDLDELLEQLGVARAAPAGPLEVTAHPEVLADAMHGALVDAIERVGAACAELWRGSGAAREARDALTTVAERLDLLVTVQDGEA
jgi:hypothetical protein